MVITDWTRVMVQSGLIFGDFEDEAGGFCLDWRWGGWVRCGGIGTELKGWSCRFRGSGGGEVGAAWRVGGGCDSVQSHQKCMVGVGSQWSQGSFRRHEGDTDVALASCCQQRVVVSESCDPSIFKAEIALPAAASPVKNSVCSGPITVRTNQLS